MRALLLAVVLAGCGGDGSTAPSAGEARDALVAAECECGYGYSGCSGETIWWPSEDGGPSPEGDCEICSGLVVDQPLQCATANDVYTACEDFLAAYCHQS